MPPFSRMAKIVRASVGIVDPTACACLLDVKASLNIR